MDSSSISSHPSGSSGNRLGVKRVVHMVYDHQRLGWLELLERQNAVAHGHRQANS